MTRRLFLAFAAVVLAACGSTPAPKLYTLDASAPGAAGSAASALSVYIGPVVVPDSVDRAQLVVRTGANEVVALDGHRWAEPLKIAIGRVLASKLARDLGTPHVGAYPGTALADAAVRVQVEVQRFESAESAVTLEAVWSVRRAAGGAATSGRTVATAPVTGGYEGMPIAHARALQALARDIAAAIRQLEAAPK